MGNYGGVLMYGGLWGGGSDVWGTMGGVLMYGGLWDQVGDVMRCVKYMC